MKQAVFDIETDGLWNECTKIWLIVIQDYQTKQIYVYGPEDSPLEEGIKHLESYDAIIGHNIVNFDIPVIQRFYPDFAKPRIIDTMIISRCQDFKRFGGGHSLDMYGQKFGLKKIKYDEWDRYTPEMRERCIVDVKLNTGVYNFLRAELKRIPRNIKAKLVDYIKAEHAMAEFCTKADHTGWDFDEEKATIFFQDLHNEMLSLEEKIEPRMGYKLKWLDSEPREVRYRKSDGHTDHVCCKYFGIDGTDALSDTPVVKSMYQRFKLEKRVLSSSHDVKDFLKSINWKPDDWNYKKVNGKIQKMSPKLTDTSLALLGEDGTNITRYNSIKSKYSILKTWIYKDLKNGKIYGDTFVIGTPSFRSRHSKIVNLPKGSTELGKRTRELFTIHDPNWSIIGIDSKSNQNRGLCHLVGDKAYTEAVVSKDIHTYNSEILSSFLDEDTFRGDADHKRNIAKTFLYAYLFGGGGLKIANVITEGRNKNPKLGEMIKERFGENIPNLGELNERMEKQFNSRGYVVAPHGVKIYLNSGHKKLVYTLQAVEKASMCFAIMLWTQKLTTYEIKYRPLIVYHDESALAVENKNVDMAIKLGLEAFHEGPKLMGIDFMEGEAKAGKNWYEVH